MIEPVLQRSIDDLRSKYPHYSEEQIKLVLNSFYDGLRHYLTHPLETKGGIIINNFITIYIKPAKIEKYLERLEIGTKRKLTPKAADVEFYKQLLQQIKDNERQTELKTKYKRSNKRIFPDGISNGEANVDQE